MFDLHVQTLDGLATRAKGQSVTDLWDEAAGLGYATATLPSHLSGEGGSLEDGAEIARAAGHIHYGAPVAQATVLLGPLLGAAEWKPREGVPAVVVEPRRRRKTRVDFGTIAGTAYVVSPAEPGTRLVELELELAAVGVGREESGAAEPSHVARIDLGSAPVLREAQLEEPFEHWLALGALAAAIQIDGSVEAVVKRTVDYLGARTQFGRELISFQTLQHRIAELKTRADLLSHAVAEAAQRWNESDTGKVRAAAVAKIEAGRVGLNAVAEAHQLHGAIGYTEEFGLGEFSKLIWSQNDRSGSPDWWTVWLARHDRRSGDLWSECAPYGTRATGASITMTAGDWTGLR